MPADFLRCSRQRGSRVITIKPKGYYDPLYIRVCYDKYGKSHRGEKSYRKSSSPKSKPKKRKSPKKSPKKQKKPKKKKKSKSPKRKR